MSDDDDFLLAIAVIVQAMSLQALMYVNSNRDQRGRCRRRWWARPINRLRREHGTYDNLFKELKETDHEEFFSFTRMSPQKFDCLLELVRPRLLKRSRRKPLPTELRLALTLSYLAHGDSVRTKSWNFRIGRSTAHKIIPEVCEALWSVLQPTYLPMMDRAKWLQVAEGFQDKWQFPNCLGAVDGKHVTIKAPPQSGSNYFCYKKHFSLLLLAACDANYKFMWVDVGQYSSLSDCSVWNNSEIVQLLENGEMDLPPPKQLPGSNISTHYAFVGDEGFPLKRYMMRPYTRKDLTDSARVFNYRLSRARRTIENAFGILVARWQILTKRICGSAENTTSIIKASVCLHNFIMSCDGQLAGMYCPPELIDREDEVHNLIEGQWRGENGLGHGQLNNVGRLGANNSARSATAQRDILKDYFLTSSGEVEWQYGYACRGLVVNAPEVLQYDADDSEEGM